MYIFLLYLSVPLESNEELSPVLKAGFTKDIRISSVDGERDFVVVEAAPEVGMISYIFIRK